MKDDSRQFTIAEFRWNKETGDAEILDGNGIAVITGEKAIHYTEKLIELITKEGSRDTL